MAHQQSLLELAEQPAAAQPVPVPLNSASAWHLQASANLTATACST